MKTLRHCLQDSVNMQVSKKLMRLVLVWCLLMLLVLRRSWKAFWKPAACCVGLSETFTLLMKVVIFLFVSLVAGDRELL